MQFICTVACRSFKHRAYYVHYSNLMQWCIINSNWTLIVIWCIRIRFAHVTRLLMRDFCSTSSHYKSVCILHGMHGQFPMFRMILIGTGGIQYGWLANKIADGNFIFWSQTYIFPFAIRGNDGHIMAEYYIKWYSKWQSVINLTHFKVITRWSFLYWIFGTMRFSF